MWDLKTKLIQDELEDFMTYVEAELKRFGFKSLDNIGQLDRYRYAGCITRAAIKANWFKGDVTVEQFGQLDPDTAREVGQAVDELFSKVHFVPKD